MFLSLHMIFSLEKAAVVWAILERISGFDPSLEMIAPRYLKFYTSSSLWPFTLISLWKPFGLFVITFVLSGPISILYLVVVVSRRSIRTPASSSLRHLRQCHLQSGSWLQVILRCWHYLHGHPMPHTWFSLGRCLRVLVRVDTLVELLL